MFWCNGRYVVFLKRSSLFEHSIVLYDLHSQIGKSLYRSRVPIEKMILRRDELICSYYKKGVFQYLRINLKDGSTHTELLFASPSRAVNILLPKSDGILSIHRICVGETCYHQIVMTTTVGSEVIEGNVADSHCTGLTVSNDERFLGYSGSNGVLVQDLFARTQVFVAEGDFQVYNCAYNGIFLVYSIKNGYFLIVNPNSSESKEMKIPVEFVDGRVFVASISPSAKFVVYNVYRRLRGSTADTLVVLQCVHSEDYKVITEMASVYDIGWSENEEFISIAGITKRDLFDFGYLYRMKNPSNHDKAVFDVNGNLIMRQQ